MTIEALTAQDRCDSCAAEALRRVELASGLELLFCEHHYQKNAAKLLEAEARVSASKYEKVEEEPVMV